MSGKRAIPWSIADFDMAKGMRETGCSFGSIARTLHRGDDEVRRVLKENGVEPRKITETPAWRADAAEWGSFVSKGWPRVPADQEDGYDKHFDAIMRETGNRGLQVCTPGGRVWGMTGKSA